MSYVIRRKTQYSNVHEQITLWKLHISILSLSYKLKNNFEIKIINDSYGKYEVPDNFGKFFCLPLIINNILCIKSIKIETFMNRSNRNWLNYTMWLRIPCHHFNDSVFGYPVIYISITYKYSKIIISYILLYLHYYAVTATNKNNESQKTIEEIMSLVLNYSSIII